MFNDLIWDPKLFDKYPSIGHMVETMAADLPDHKIMAYKTSRGWQDLSFHELIEKVRAIAAGLNDLAIKPGERVAILCDTRIEWAMSDLGILAGACVSVPIYHSALPDEGRYILENSQAVAVFVQNYAQLEKIRKIWPELPKLKYAILLTEPTVDEDDKRIIDLQQLIGRGLTRQARRPGEYRKRLEALTPESLASLVYTSGTTGPPKGAMLTHGNFLYVCWALTSFIEVGQKDRHLSHLPLAHIYERVGGLMAMLYTGCKICYGTGIDNLSREIIEVRPTILITVPRLFEKIYAGMMAHIQENSKLNRRLVEWAMELGETCLDYEQSDTRVPAHLTVQRRLADRLVYSRIRDRFGGKLRMAVSSSAPIANEILRFLSIIGLEVLEVWGMTETTGPITSNRIGFQKIGSVGPPIPGTEIKLNKDGEVLVRGPQVMQGYYRDEASTAAISKDGWLATGDIGELSGDGFLSITDRKKDIIITAGGKNVAPQNLEGYFKLEPLFSEFLIFGDRRKFLVALVTLEEQQLFAWAKKVKLQFTDYADLTKKPEVRELVESIIREKNKALPNYETIKRFAILDHQFTREGEELTPTMKVVRRKIADVYKDLIDSLYAGLKDGKI